MAACTRSIEILSWLRYMKIIPNFRIHKARLYLFILSGCGVLANGQLDALYIVIILYVSLGQADRDVKDTDRSIYMRTPGLCSRLLFQHSPLDWNNSRRSS